MNTKKILKITAIVLTVLLLIALGLVFWAWLLNRLNSPTIEPVANVYGALEKGKWGWAREGSSVSCGNNPHMIEFREDNTEAVIRFAKKIHSADGSVTDTAIYKILGKDGNRITMRIVGEKRLDDKGQPVVWDLVMLNENEYAWHRLDWRQGLLTPHIRRCAE